MIKIFIYKSSYFAIKTLKGKSDGSEGNQFQKKSKYG